MSHIEQKRICYLMAVYNDPQGMLRTLNSLFTDAPLADIVIVDDGSTPPLAIPPGFSATLLRLAQNGGIARALNHGLTHILEKPYDFIARIDAGDEVLPGRLSAQLAYLDHHPTIAVLGTQMDAFDAQTGGFLFRLSNPLSPEKTLPLRNTLAHPSVMIRASALRQVGLYDPSYLYAEDYELWCRMAQHYDLANLPDVWTKKEMTPRQIIARNRHKTRSARLRAQLKYFNPLSLYCWLGIMRSLVSFTISRDLWLALRQGKMQLFKPVSASTR